MNKAAFTSLAPGGPIDPGPAFVFSILALGSSQVCHDPEKDALILSKDLWRRFYHAWNGSFKKLGQMANCAAY